MTRYTTTTSEGTGCGHAHPTRADAMDCAADHNRGKGETERRNTVRLEPMRELWPGVYVGPYASIATARLLAAALGGS